MADNQTITVRLKAPHGGKKAGDTITVTPTQYAAFRDRMEKVAGSVAGTPADVRAIDPADAIRKAGSSIPDPAHPESDPAPNPTAIPVRAEESNEPRPDRKVEEFDGYSVEHRGTWRAVFVDGEEVAVVRQAQLADKLRDMGLTGDDADGDGDDARGDEPGPLTRAGRRARRVASAVAEVVAGDEKDLPPPAEEGGAGAGA